MLRINRTMLTGLGLGVGLMYFLDPERGRRRRALIRDKVAHAAHAGNDAIGAFGRDISHRLAGVRARASGAFHGGPVDDSVLVERVRSRMGRVVSHPQAIEVDAADGCVRLRGSILQSELPGLMQTIARVRGVRSIDNNLRGLNGWQRA
jgi:osmotically-inducible protein OsmY